jgi:acyl-CoA synthetase (NDP forming)
LPLLEDLERGLAAVGHLVAHAAACRRAATSAAVPKSGAGTVPPLPPGRILTEAESKPILAAAGLPVTRERLARTPVDAVRIATDIGPPVALKIQSVDIAHKSDIGGVHLGARTAAEVEAAARQILDNAGSKCPTARIDGILVQEMVQDGVEFILGMTYDEQFGPLVVCGAGGVNVEVFKDVAVGLPPLTSDQVRDMLHRLDAGRLLGGFRGAPPADVDALVECCVRFSQFVAATDGRIAAIDLNPVFVLPRGRGVRIADALIEMRDDTGGKA